MRFELGGKFTGNSNPYKHDKVVGDTCNNQDDANVVVVYLKILMTNPSMGPEDDGIVSLRGYQTQDIGTVIPKTIRFR